MKSKKFRKSKTRVQRGWRRVVGYGALVVGVFLGGFATVRRAKNKGDKE